MDKKKKKASILYAEFKVSSDDKNKEELLMAQVEAQLNKLIVENAYGAYDQKQRWRQHEPVSFQESRFLITKKEQPLQLILGNLYSAFRDIETDKEVKLIRQENGFGFYEKATAGVIIELQYFLELFGHNANLTAECSTGRARAWHISFVLKGNPETKDSFQVLDVEFTEVYWGRTNRQKHKKLKKV